MRRALALAVVVLAGLAGASPSAAEVQVVGFADAQRSISNPVFLDDGAILLAADGWDRTQRLLRVDPGRPPRVLAELPDVDLVTSTARDALQLRIAASEQAVGVARTSATCSGRQCAAGFATLNVADAVVGTAAGGFRVVAGCTPPACGGLLNDSCRTSVPAVTGDLVAVDDRCGGPERERVQPLGTLWRPGAAAPALSLPLGEALVDLHEGHTLGVVNDFDARETDLVLRDAATGAELRRLTLPWLQYGAHLADGDRIVFTRSVEQQVSVLVAAPGGEPAAVDVGVPAASLVGVDGARLLLVDQRGQLHVVDLDGARPTTVTQLGAAGTTRFGSPIWQPAIAGDRVATVVQPCQTGVLVVRDAGEPLPAELTGRCPVARPVGPLLRGRRTLGIALRCPADPLRGCSGQLAITLRSAGERRRLGWGRIRSFAIAAGATTVFRVPLTRGVRRFERRFGIGGARIRVATQNGGRKVADVRLD